MSEASSTGSSGKKRSSQESMEEDEADNNRGEAPPSVKKAKAVKGSMEVDEAEEALGNDSDTTPSEKKANEVKESVDAKVADTNDEMSVEAPPSAKKAKKVQESLEEKVTEKTGEISLETPKKGRTVEKQGKDSVEEEADESLEKSPKAPPSEKRVKGAKKEDKESMEVEDAEEALEKSPEASPSDKKAMGAKKEAKDEFESEGEDEARKAALAERKKKFNKATKDITKMWVNEEPYVNVERPIPAATRSNFTWYDLTDEWSEDKKPEAVPVDRVDLKFNYGRDGYVELPFSERQTSRSLGTSSRPRGELIREAITSFSNGVRDLTHLEAGIKTYWKDFSAKCLRKMFKDQSEEVCTAYLELITKIAKIALRSKHLVTIPLPLLTAKGIVKSVSMSQEQAACLLAYAFFCTVLPRHDDFNHFTFHLFHVHDSQIYIEKMKFILYYFKTVAEEMPRGTLTYSRQAWNFQRDERSGYDTWADPLSEVLATPEGLIEEMTGCLQVDFANQFIGGGVGNTGAVQEEIRFLCCPEMLVSLLLCDRMESNEAILIQGAQQYSAYKGYAGSLRHEPMEYARDEPRDRFGRARSYLVAIDAVSFKRASWQYESKFITRETKKAYAGFMCLGGNDAPARPIATGNWGCGVFNGDKELKSLIQLIAASKARRSMIYVTFNDEAFAEQLQEIVDVLRTSKVKNGKLFEVLINYHKARQDRETVFQFVRRVVQAGVSNC